jgi:hypothetical protein
MEPHSKIETGEVKSEEFLMRRAGVSDTNCLFLLLIKLVATPSAFRPPNLEAAPVLVALPQGRENTLEYFQLCIGCVLASGFYRKVLSGVLLQV